GAGEGRRRAHRGEGAVLIVRSTESASEHDVVVLTKLLGRPPRAGFEVVVRDRTGDPVVIRNAPLLDDGTPMPTRYWLVDPELSLRLSRLESGRGGRPGQTGRRPGAPRAPPHRFP